MSLSAPFLTQLRAAVGDDACSTASVDRLASGRDLWPRSLLQSRSAPLPGPSVVVWPGSVAEVQAVVRVCAQARVPLVPFGAGSGVCGGALATPGQVVLDLKRLKRVRTLDAARGLVEVEAGLNGELFERALERHGLTLGHFPSSIQCSTVGGWVAARSAGQCSPRYGKIEDMVVELEVVTGEGRLRRTPPAGAPGPDWNQLFIGSEGTLGVVTATTLRVHPQPTHRAFRGYMAPTLEAGFEIMRRTLQAGHRPAVLRLYDPVDTLMAGQKASADVDTHASKRDPAGGARLRTLLAGLSQPEGFGARVLRNVLASASLFNAVAGAVSRRSLLVTVCEGERAEATAADAALAEHARAVGAVDLGEAPGRHWLAHRHDVSYKQSRLYRAGAFVDTFEVATTWSGLGALYTQVREALAPHAVVMAHFSHPYPGGCSIYFTFVGTGDSPAAMRARYDAAWDAALGAARTCGAALAHHHGVGLSRARHLGRAHGDAVRWFEALKATFDPAGILNPGKIYERAS